MLAVTSAFDQISEFNENFMDNVFIQSVHYH
jgi:hypothetical protein